jgi:hypothetical protein
MDELVPVLLAFVLGTAIWRHASARIRPMLVCLVVAISGLGPTVLSGEFRESWLYLLLDIGEAASGLILGFVIAHRLLRPAPTMGVGQPNRSLSEHQLATPALQRE